MLIPMSSSRVLRPAVPRVYGGGVMTRSTLYSYQVARLKKDVKSKTQKLEDKIQEVEDLKEERDRLQVQSKMTTVI
jgi:hypothetical protein